ncbi:MAG TPA: MarR family transcriptional regulator [Noviherbaspirillum sp.]
MKRYFVGIRPPDQPSSDSTLLRRQTKNQPTVWFASMGSLAAILSDDNRALLRIIRDVKPQSLTELAELTGRKVSNVSRTLKTMADYGLVQLQRGKSGVRPIAMATSFTILLD